MPVRSVKELASLQENPGYVRNICILAHVDHGKTTLADALVASNGIISQRMAGKMRYMDSREDEQERGITMKSSAISLFYQKDKEYLVNLIDSPGHIDFSSEVSTAVRLCEGAIVLVDVVEGVCPQTHAVFRQAWLENLRPILVLNKIDRLICELKMSPLEAFLHLQNILVQVNLVTSQLFTSEAMLKFSNVQSPEQPYGGSAVQSYDWTYIEDEEEEKNIFFSPDRGNVIFASAIDGWGFTLDHFASMYSLKLGINRDVLQKTLWGDYYVNMKAKRILKGAQSKGKKPLFVQFVLDNLWAVYEAVVLKRDKDMTEKIIKSLGLSMSARDMRHSDPRVQLCAVTSQWLPVSDAVLSVVVEQLPSPLQISEEKVEKLMCGQSQQFQTFPSETQALKTDFLACSSSDEAPVIVFVSKMFPFEKKFLPQNRARPLTGEELHQRAHIARQRYAETLAQTSSNVLEAAENKNGETTVTATEVKDQTRVGAETMQEKVASDGDIVFIAFARIFSGRIRKGQRLFILGPKHSPAKALIKGEKEVASSVRQLGSEQYITSFVVDDLYMFMGRELELLEHVPAGNILGIGGLEDHILKSATVSSTLACSAFSSLYFDAAPILRVAVEPAHPSEMKQVEEGLRLLNQADPCVQVLLQETGEMVIITAGEVHLQRCVDDLRQRYAKVEVNISKPIVPFRETIIPRPRVDRVNEAIHDLNTVIVSSRLKEFEDDKEVLDEGLVEMLTPNNECVIRIRALPLPAQVVSCIVDHQEALRALDRLVEQSDQTASNQQKIQESLRLELVALHKQLITAFDESDPQWKDAADHIWSFGPKRCGPNILFNRVQAYQRPSVWTGLEDPSKWGHSEGELWVNDSSIVAGFQMATLAGPLCEEPMHGVAFLIEQWGDASLRLGKPQAKASEENNWNCEAVGDAKDMNSHSDLRKQLKELNIDIESCVKDSDKNSQSEAIKSSVTHKKRDAYGPMSGQIMSTVKDGCRKAFQTMPQRLMQAMYECSILATNDILGKMYAVIGKRNGHVLHEELIEGTQMFKIVTEFPVVDSFGLAEEMRKRTSGLANPQLRFSHWEVLDLDPFWVPSTEEEYVHFGEKADNVNRARAFMNEVRRRKGLKVDEKIVEFAEKQRTLTRNK